MTSAVAPGTNASNASAAMFSVIRMSLPPERVAVSLRPTVGRHSHHGRNESGVSSLADQFEDRTLGVMRAFIANARDPNDADRHAVR
jgi:hypothetical protein